MFALLVLPAICHFPSIKAFEETTPKYELAFELIQKIFESRILTIRPEDFGEWGLVRERCIR
jgi:hypothetical protein